MINIIVPQAVKNIFPALCNEFITLIKETAIVGYVGLVDIQKAGDFIKSATYLAFMPLIATAIIYFIIIKILTILLGKVEKRLRKADVR
jgi:polar amino acid transport system permease protein/polar amino acid transport system substrate-binding protein